MIALERLGRRLSTERRAQSLSQRSMAQRVGVSASLISQIETGKVQPSVATLMAVANELGMSIDQLLADEDPPNGEAVDDSTASRRTAGVSSASSPAAASVPASDGAPPVRRLGRPAVLQSHAARERIELSSGIIWERLTADSDRHVDFMLVTYPPGACSSVGDQLLTHPGHEYWYVMSGQLRVQVAFDVYIAGPDDSFSFECTRPHQFRNDGDTPVRAVVMVVHLDGTR